jgi:multiple sugar transport system substrate-binding protein
METNIGRRRLVAIVAGAASIALLAGCTGNGAGNGSAEEDPDAPVTLEVALWGDASRADLYQSAIDLYEEAHPNVTIELEFADLTPYLERLATSAAAKDLPDVMFMRDTHIGRYGESGALLDLSEYIGDTIDVDDLGEAAVSTGEVNDGVYALPTHYVGQAVIYNEGVFADNGIDPEDIATWDDLAEAAKELSDPDAGFWGLNDPTVDVTHRAFEAFVRQNGEELFTEDGEVGFSEDVAAEWFTYWSDLRNDGAIPPADVQIEANSSGFTNNVLVTGRAAMGLQSSNHLTQIQALTETPYAMTSLPQTADSTDDWWFFPPILISAAGNTPHPEAAAEFINFLLNDVDAGLLTGVNQGAPSSSVIREELLPELTDQQAAFVEQIQTEQENPARPFPIRPEGAEALNTALTRAGEEIAYGRKSVEEAVETLMADADRAVG